MTTSELESQLAQAREALSNARRDAEALGVDLEANLAAERLVGDLERLVSRLDSELTKQREFERVAAEEQKRAEARAECDRHVVNHHEAMATCAETANTLAYELEAALKVIDAEANILAESFEGHRYAFRRANDSWPDIFTEGLQGRPYTPSAEFLPDTMPRSNLYGAAVVGLTIAAHLRAGDDLEVAVAKVAQPQLQRYVSKTGLELAPDRY